MPKRTANGEGNIRKRKDGRWEGRYTVGYDPETGKLLSKNVLGKTQAEVKEKLAVALDTMKKVDVAVSANMTTGDWLDTWLDHFAKPVMRPSTYANYETLIRLHIKPHIGEVKLNKLSTLQLQKLYNTLLANGGTTARRQRTSPRASAAKR